MMELTGIIHECGTVSVSGRTDLDISGICSDSRKAVPGSLFIAVRGYAADGHGYISNAIGNGAVAIMYEDDSLSLIHI